MGDKSKKYAVRLILRLTYSPALGLHPPEKQKQLERALRHHSDAAMQQ